jgi:hypothetical protein
MHLRMSVAVGCVLLVCWQVQHYAYLRDEQKARDFLLRIVTRWTRSRVTAGARTRVAEARTVAPRFVESNNDWLHPCVPMTSARILVRQR